MASKASKSRSACNSVCPVWMQNAGLEWFYRFLQEPRRMFRRYFIDDMAFVALFAREWVKR